MNISDKLADKTIAHEIGLMRVEAKEKKKILSILIGLEKEIKKELYKYKGIIYIQDPPHKKRLEKKLISIKSMIKTNYQNIYKSQQILFKELVEYEWKFAQSSIYNTIGISVNATVPSIELLKSLAKDTLIMGSLAKDKWAIQANSLYTKVSDQIRMGLLLGEAPAQLSRRIAPGVTGAARRNATALARTSFHGVVQRARFESYQELEDVIKGYQWLSTLDGRTSLICISLSNNTWNLAYKPIMGTSKPFPGHPPLHWNCRSTLLPLIRSFKELALSPEIGGKIKELPKSTQSSLDGYVASDMTYLDWLKNQSYVMQKKVLGSNRRRLWVDGKLEAKDLIDQSYRPLTLKELKNR